jgi:hypothetical protein
MSYIYTLIKETGYNLADEDPTLEALKIASFLGQFRPKL